MATKHPLDGLTLPVHAGGRAPTLKHGNIVILRDIVTERAQASLEEIADELHRRSGVRVCAVTIRRAVSAQGIVRIKPTRRVYTASSAQPTHSRSSATAIRPRTDKRMCCPTALI